MHCIDVSFSITLLTVEEEDIRMLFNATHTHNQDLKKKKKKKKQQQQTTKTQKKKKRS